MTTLSSPIGCISKAEERLRNMLAACQPMQAWLGVTNAADAKEKIYLWELPRPLFDDEERDGTFSLSEITSRRPYALISTPEENAFRIKVIASPCTPSPSGVLRVRFIDNVPEELKNNYVEAYRRFINAMGMIMHSGEPHNPGLMELLHDSRYDCLPIQDVVLSAHGRGASDEQPTMGDWHGCEWEITWGADQ